MNTTGRSFSTASGAGATHGVARAGLDDPDHGHQTVPSDLTLRVKALESLLVEKGLVDPAALDALIDTYEHKVGPRNGARVVARSWVDPAYKGRNNKTSVETCNAGRAGAHPYRAVWPSPRR